MSKSTFAAFLFAPFCLLSVACANIDPGDDVVADGQVDQAQSALSASTSRTTCEEEVDHFVVDGDTEEEALGACKKVCEDVFCPDGKNDAVASIPGKAGDDDTWKCDCTCECDGNNDGGRKQMKPVPIDH